MQKAVCLKCQDIGYTKNATHFNVTNVLALFPRDVLLPTAFCLLLPAYCLPPSAYRLPPTAY